ncbi:ParB/RepB/Spo0J family partition protein [Pseudalkalibacillus salsuginis]|uniref:ParB/RepB/Spo0J family partition protein n=1 Tax=Pseudalkalibacillus salsuginis TaxID=2910972 RepID=UPI001F19BD3E|nr:ParB/RepB/Spo0J family partition protein [Pseudalkalibacillus salsuginis]MCF6410718.1 ParB/RepB/Spo0J family partition protein [Pseudalkalibacillus salsuginis]
MARGLGKGFNALFPANELETEQEIQEIELGEIRPNPYQPRKTFDQKAIDELKESIETHGILQPIIVRKTIKGYEIVVGERRYRAAKETGLKKIPVIVKELNEQKMMELAMIENLQREDLNPIEEGQAYASLMQELELTQEQLAHRLGKSRPHIANHLRLLQLPSLVQQLLAEKKLSMGHGRALLAVKNKAKISPLVQRIIKENLSVRQVETIIQQMNKNVSRETKKRKPEKNVFVKEKEETLRERFGTTVSIRQNKRKGKIEIDFFSQDDLNRILEMLEGKE